MIIVGDDDAPTPCRHCQRILRYFDGPWLDADGGLECRPGLAHQPMPDGGDMALDIAQAFHPEDFHA